MRPKSFFGGVLWLALATGAVLGAESDSGVELPVGTTVHRVTTLQDPNQSYALYLPTGYGDRDRLWPVLIVLDPRGRAVPGVERFLPAAERHGYVVLSSYQSRRDTSADVNVRALDALLAEIQARFRFHRQRLYLAGMSGTAHASWRFAQILEDHVAGVIAAGGGVQTGTQGPPGDARFAYYGMAGTADFNFQELLRLEEHMLERGIDHRIVIFEGRHHWPPFAETNRALDWMELQAVKRGLTAPRPELIAAELERARAAAAEADDPMERLRRLRDVVRDFPDAPGIEADREALRRLESDPAVSARQAEERRLAKRERAYTDQVYTSWFATLQDETRRMPTVAESLIALRIGVLRKQASDLDNLAEARSAQRSLESLYTGVAYYHPENFEEAGDFERAIRSLEVAVAIFPERARAHWSLASTLVRCGRHEDGLEALRRAIGFGRVDVERLETDPTWKPLHERPEWAELLAAAKGATASGAR